MYLSVLLAAILGITSNVDAKVDSSKYTVALQFETMGYRCAAGIINDRFLISSGECFANQMNAPVKVPSISAVVEGTNGKVEVKVDVVYSPYFYAGRYRAIHDIAVLKLKESLDLQENGLVALRLPEASSMNDNNNYKGTVASVSRPGQQNHEKLKVVDWKECSAKAFNSLMPTSQFCAQLTNNNHKCSGDRGSPVVEGDDLLIGVQLSCSDDLPYMLFEKVSYFRNIIDSMLAGTPGPYSTITYPRV